VRRLLVVFVLAAATGCGDDGASRAGVPASYQPSDRLVDFSKKPPYVNSFDLDPETGEYLLTTNRGFFRIEPKTDEVTRERGTITAGRRSSTVGTFLELHVTGPGTLLGSGHPDTKDQLPPFLGLIASDDDGETWRVVSRLGNADLHKIVLKHDRMYAFDAVLGAMLISTDDGRTFSEHFTPRQLVTDFEVDPEDPDRIFAATDTELFRSEDGGEGWRAVEQTEGIRLVWTAPDVFVRAQRDGTVSRSSDGGGSWQEIGQVPGEPYDFKAIGTEEFLLALSDGSVLHTRDGGRSWQEEFRP
jgi:hypothetical protein